MDKCGQICSKVLLTSDSRYIPGYAGYCPQLKYTMGRSYGQLTAELLNSPEVKQSNHSVLKTGHIPSTKSDGALTLRSISDSNLNKVIPGYTGFIPKRQHYFACSYSETCHKAVSEFNQYQLLKIQRQSTDLPALVNYTDQQLERQKPPLTAISDKVFSYKPLKPFIPPGKPYFMDDDDPNKYFISGYTGHVPKSRFLIGKDYPSTTNQALIQFGKQQRSDPESKDTSGGKDSTITPMPTIYPSKKGVVPSFTGHIPGYQFMYGHTFGKLSQNSLEKSSIKRTLQTQSENYHTLQ